MQKKTFITFPRTGLCVILLSVLTIFAACGTSSQAASPTNTATTAAAPTATATTTAATTPTASSQSGSSVSISDFAFSPAALTASVGTTVTWTNKDSVTHTVTDDKGAFNHSVPPGQTFKFTFTKAGTYTYHCSIHPSMRATVVVH
jgi:plastocyanin